MCVVDRSVFVRGGPLEGSRSTWTLTRFNAALVTTNASWCVMASSVLAVKKRLSERAGQVENLQITKVHECRSKSNTVNVLHIKQLTTYEIFQFPDFPQFLFSYLAEDVRRKAGG